MLTEISASAVD